MKRSKKANRKNNKLTSRDLQENAILAGLEDSERDSVQKGAALVELEVRHPIYGVEQSIREVYFPMDCVLSVVTQMEDGTQIEIGTIGREGTSGIPLLLGSTTTANESYCQVPGRAIKIAASLFQSLRSNKKFRQLLDRYIQAYVNMLGQLAACNRLHHIYQRCARWLLMTHDRVGVRKIPLTHEYLAMMLGSQRSGVTVAAAMLQSAGFIRYSHGVVTILDREGLRGASCECYDVARKQFAGLLRPVIADG